MKRRLSAVLLMLCLVIGLMPASAFAAPEARRVNDTEFHPDGYVYVGVKPVAATKEITLNIYDIENHKQVKEEKIYVEGGDVNHMKNVLRMKTGEELTVNDGEGSQYLCAVESYEADMAVLKILEKKQDESELASKIYLFQGLPKQDKMELIVQKSVELGAYQVIPVATKRAVVKLDAKKAKKKVERWQQIAVSAAKQAGRGIIPEVGEVCTYAQALKQAEELDVVLIPYELAKGMEETKQIIAGIRPGQSVGIFIGPEGGFEEEEVALAMKTGANPVTLGKRILRTETAGLTMLSVLMFHLEG